MFNNRIAGVLEAPVFGPELADPLSAAPRKRRQRAFQRGTTGYTGAKLSGSGFTAELWAMPLTASSFAPVPGATTTFRTGGGIGFIVPPAADTVIPDVLPGERAMLELRAWDNQGGTVNDWLTAASLGLDEGSPMPFSPTLWGAPHCPACPLPRRT